MEFTLRDSKSSLVYRYPFLYTLFLKIRYGIFYQDRYKMLAKHIKNNTSVFELCPGDLVLYEGYLKNMNVHYGGIEIGESFVKNAKDKNIDLIQGNVLKEDFTLSDYVIIQGSLCQFHDDALVLVGRMLDAAKSKVIINESIRSFGQSSIPIIKWVARRSIDPGTGHCMKRFDEDSLRLLGDKIKNTYGHMISNIIYEKTDIHSFANIKGGGWDFQIVIIKK